eukprot:6200365-Pleurochrysis_carterae.AAC.1
MRRPEPQAHWSNRQSPSRVAASHSLDLAAAAQCQPGQTSACSFNATEPCAYCLEKIVPVVVTRRSYLTAAQPASIVGRDLMQAASTCG